MKKFLKNNLLLYILHSLTDSKSCGFYRKILLVNVLCKVDGANKVQVCKKIKESLILQPYKHHLRVEWCCCSLVACWRNGSAKIRKTSTTKTIFRWYAMLVHLVGQRYCYPAMEALNCILHPLRALQANTYCKSQASNLLPLETLPEFIGKVLVLSQ